LVGGTLVTAAITHPGDLTPVLAAARSLTNTLAFLSGLTFLLILLLGNRRGGQSMMVRQCMVVVAVLLTQHSLAPVALQHKRQAFAVLGDE